MIDVIRHCRIDLPCYLFRNRKAPVWCSEKSSVACQGLELLVHLDGYSGPQKDGWEALKQLAAASSLVITEEMPTSPFAQWSKVSLTLPDSFRCSQTLTCASIQQHFLGLSRFCGSRTALLLVLCVMGACEQALGVMATETTRKGMLLLLGNP